MAPFHVATLTFQREPTPPSHLSISCALVGTPEGTAGVTGALPLSLPPSMTWILALLLLFLGLMLDLGTLRGGGRGKNVELRALKSALRRRTKAWSWMGKC